MKIADLKPTEAPKVFNEFKVETGVSLSLNFKTPKAAVKSLEELGRKVFSNPDMNEMFNKLDMTYGQSGPKSFSLSFREVKTRIDKLAKAVETLENTQGDWSF